jgi:hypothetical protein
MRKKTKNIHDEGFWPGYVDALTNVVLNLLFLISILAAGVFSLGLESGRKVTQPYFPELKAVPAAKLLQAAPADLVKKIQVSVVKTASPDQSRVHLNGVRRVDGRQEASLGFGAEASQISETDKREILPKLQHLLDQSKGDIVVWTAADTKDPVQRRAAYLRIMAVRDLLVNSGLSTDRITTRLLAGGSNRGSGQSIFVLF